MASRSDSAGESPSPPSPLPRKAGGEGLTIDAASGLFGSRNPEPEIVQVEILALLALGEVAAIDADAQEAPQARLLAVVVVAVGVGIGFEQPAPTALLIAGLRLLLPALHHPRDR